MDVNAINNNNINNISPQTQHLGQTANTNRIQNTPEDDKSSEVSLKISNTNKRSDTASYLSTLNNNLVDLKKEAQALQKQQDILKEIKTITVDAAGTQLTAEGKVEVKKQLDTLIDQFKNTSVESKNQNQNELASIAEESTENVNSVERGNNFDIGVSSTTFIGADLSYIIDSLDFNPNDLGNEILKVDAGLAKLEDYIKENGNNQKDILKNGQNYIKNEITNSENDFAKSKVDNPVQDSNDFSKTNITAQQGYLVASQANIVQEQSFRLLA